MQTPTDIVVVVSTYRARAGEEDAIIALHEDWQRNQGRKAKNYLSWELLRNVEAPCVFVAIAHYADEAQAQRAETELAQDAWYPRLVSLLEEEPARANYRRSWAAL